MELDSVRIKVINCAKTYPDGTRGLQPTSLIVEPGEVMALLGPSGCGKTTLLRLIAGLEVPDVGSQILFGEQEVTYRPLEQRGVGMVFQHYALFPQMTVEANIGYGLRIRGMPEGQRKIAVGELIDLVRLQGLEKKRPAELSGGQRQRVALARAIAVKPRVLLLDEPLTALDAKLKEALRDELAQLLRRLQITAIHVTHDQQEALAIADRLAIMHAGRIVQVGIGEVLYRNPVHPFVAEFLGRVNRIERSSKDVESGTVTIGGATWACPAQLSNQVALLVRPEDIQLGELQAQWGTAIIERRVFLGQRIQLHLKTAEQTLSVEVGRDCHYLVGNTVGLRIAPERLMPSKPKEELV